MHFIIYNPNSKGGNFKYAQFTAKGLVEAGHTINLVLPRNAEVDIKNACFEISKSLVSDMSNANGILLKKLHFLYRVFVNPIRFFFFLKKQKPTYVIFNDFDQLSALFWVRLLSLLKRKHKFSVILHDPDRDAYPGGVAFSRWSMKALMCLMDVAFFHERLPDKPYYRNFGGNKVSIPHGLYPPAPTEEQLVGDLRNQKSGKQLLCIPGNIRMEKNYELIIEALKELPECMLLVAGAPSSSGVRVEQLRALAENMGVEKQIIWIVKYLSEQEFTAVLEASDLILLYYKQSFSSQSGILNQIAPMKRNVLVSETESALTKLSREFGIGTLAEPDSKPAFVAGVKVALANETYQKRWEDYLHYASWEKQAQLIAASFSQ